MIFFNRLKQMIWKLIIEKQTKFNRTLPMGDYFVDRWEKAKFLNFGEGSSIYDSSLVFGNVNVGKNCWIGPFTILDGSGGELTIGDNTHISAGTQIYTHDTVNKVIKNTLLKKGPVSIGNNSYIGPNVIISLNVNIGEYVTIGANSFVNKNIPDNGSPFKKVTIE